MEAEKYTRMYVEILNGKTKAESRYREEPGFDQEWDELVAEISRIREANPGAQFDIPN